MVPRQSWNTTGLGWRTEAVDNGLFPCRSQPAHGAAPNENIKHIANRPTAYVANTTKLERCTYRIRSVLAYKADIVCNTMRVQS